MPPVVQFKVYVPFSIFNGPSLPHFSLCILFLTSKYRRRHGGRHFYLGETLIAFSPLSKSSTPTRLSASLLIRTAGGSVMVVVVVVVVGPAQESSPPTLSSRAPPPAAPGDPYGGVGGGGGDRGDLPLLLRRVRRRGDGGGRRRESHLVSSPPREERPSPRALSRRCRTVVGRSVEPPGWRCHLLSAAGETDLRRNAAGFKGTCSRKEKY